MSLKSKAKAAEKRAQQKMITAKEILKVSINAERLITMTAGFARTTRSSSHVDMFEKSKMPRYEVPRKEVRHVEKRFVAPEPELKPSLSPEMEKREQLAQERYREMKSLVQPLGNKMGYQYPDQSYIEASKRGELKRR